MQSKTCQFTYQQIAELLVKAAEIKEGYWGIQLRFGLQGANIAPQENVLVPAAIVAITEVGLQEFPGPNSLAVDAAEIAGRTAKKRAKKPAKKRAKRPAR